MNKELGAKIDEIVSQITGAEKWTVSGGEGTPKSIIHMRGGRQVGVRHLDDTVSVMHSNDIVQEYDAYGNLTERYRIENPPEGYTIMNEDDVNSFLEQLSFSQKGGMMN